MDNKWVTAEIKDIPWISTKDFIPGRSRIPLLVKGSIGIVLKKRTFVHSDYPEASDHYAVFTQGRVFVHFYSIVLFDHKNHNDIYSAEGIFIRNMEYCAEIRMDNSDYKIEDYEKWDDIIGNKRWFSSKMEKYMDWDSDTDGLNFGNDHITHWAPIV